MECYLACRGEIPFQYGANEWNGSLALEGTKVTYTCYYSEGTATTVCGSNGTWSTITKPCLPHGEFFFPQLHSD